MIPKRFLQKLEIVFLIASILFFVQCSNRKNQFSIEVDRYSGGAGITRIYKLTDQFIQFETDCDLQNCKKEIVYYRKLTKDESDRIFKSLSVLQLDTLKNIYKPEGIVFDGLTITVKIKGLEFVTKKPIIDNVDLPAIDSLQKIINHLNLAQE